MLELNFLWHFTKVALGSKNMIEIKKNLMARFYGLPRDRSHLPRPKSFEIFKVVKMSCYVPLEAEFDADREKHNFGG